jgi:hypothetical protein
MSSLVARVKAPRSRLMNMKVSPQVLSSVRELKEQDRLRTGRSTTIINILEMALDYYARSVAPVRTPRSQTPNGHKRRSHE